MAAALDASLICRIRRCSGSARAADDLAKRSSSDPLMTAQVKRVLHDVLRSDEAHIELVAKRLGLTGRSLQRRLKDEGTSFQEVREQVRRDLAQRYLDDGLAIAEISFLLGFSEPSAFFRAFKRWTGETPLAHRRAVPHSPDGMRSDDAQDHERREHHPRQRHTSASRPSRPLPATAARSSDRRGLRFGANDEVTSRMTRHGSGCPTSIRRLRCDVTAGRTHMDCRARTAGPAGPRTRAA
jgi:AraC-like DNA-binding protein